MRIKFAEKVTTELVKSQKIKLEDQELYRYGIEQGILILLNVLTALAIGLIFHCLFYVVIFSVAFVPLRSYAGGFHAKTFSRCYILSVLMLISFCVFNKISIISKYSFIIIYILCSIIILILSPVETKTKPLDELETKVYRKKTRFILIFEFTLSIFIRSDIFIKSISFSFVITGSTSVSPPTSDLTCRILIISP